MENYVKYQTVEGISYVRKITMTAMLKELPEEFFSRVHKSYVVNDRLIYSISGDFLYMSDVRQTKIPIGDAYRTAFFVKEGIKQIKLKKGVDKIDINMY